MKISIFLSALLVSCVVKKNVESNTYSRPPLDFHDTDEDIEYLPEAGEIKGDNKDETDTDEDEIK